MADIAIGVYEYEKHEHAHQEQEQEQQQLRGFSSASSAQLYQQQQPQNGYLLVAQDQQQQQQQLPKQQLSLQQLNPFPSSVYSYTIFLTSTLVVWILYLILPRGVRKQYFRANRKRYTKRLDRQMPAAGYWMPVQSMKAQSTATTPSFDNASTVSSNHHYSSAIIAAAAARNKERNNGAAVPPAIHTNNSYSNKNDNDTPLTQQSSYSSSSSPSSPPRHKAAMLKHPPSPEHPALKKIPPNKIIAETMARLQGRGIRLVAHGVHCDPKRVWIRLQEEEGKVGYGASEPSVTWQTEFPRRVPDQNGNVSIVLMRGSLHSIGLKNILYIDVGKKTHALQLTRGVPESMCLSLLTQNGSLDLQANSKLERDSLVSCFSMILDDIHEEDWRALYEASPEPSLANSSTVVGGYNGNHLSYSNFDNSTTPGSSNFQTPSPYGNMRNNMNTSNTSEEKDRMLQLL
jgi:hypothetical protein